MNEKQSDNASVSREECEAILTDPRKSNSDTCKRLSRAHISLLDSSEQTIVELRERLESCKWCPGVPVNEFGNHIIKGYYGSGDAALPCARFAVKERDTLRSRLAQAHNMREALRLGDADGIRAAIWAFDKATRSEPIVNAQAPDGEVDTKVEKIQKIVDLYFMPWGAAKAAMWGELAGDGPFNDARALKLIHDILHPESTKEKSPARQMA